MKPVKCPFNEAVIAKTHPPLYLMHKFWARKPHNVVARYIEYYTDPGDVVLDPFMGSGVTVIEAARLGRKAIGNDLNPIACFIARMTLVPIDLTKLQAAFFRVETAAREKIDSYYKVTCTNPKCGEDAITTHVVWRQDKFKGEKMFLLKVSCPHCGQKEERKPTDDDLQRYEAIAAEGIPYFYPKDIKLHPTAKRSVEFIHELFTHRALICLSILWKELTAESDSRLRDLLKFCFTSAVSQASKLVFIIKKRGGKQTHRYEVGSWTVPNYWVPDEHFEINVWNCFLERYKKVKRGKSTQSPSLSAAILDEDATALKSVHTKSVDYIFTDPPYGDAVPYFGLSLMWAAWLGWDEKLDFDHEIIISERGDYEKELEDYRKSLKESFREMFRVLKNNGTVTVTFHNREIRVWNALVAAAFDAGFVYENDNYVLPPRVSAKSLLAKSGSMTGDIYINFRKPPKVELQGEFTYEEAKRIIGEEAKMIIQSRNGQATTDQLARGIYSQLIKRNLFNRLPSTDIRNVLGTLPLREVMPNVWSLPTREAQMMLAYIPLHKRIEFIVDSVLERNHKHGLDLDDFLVPIFTQLKNGLTPDNKEILEVLRQRAEVKRDKWYPLRERQIELLPEYELPKKAVLPEEELREHEQFIYQLARLGATLGYQIWVGNNEQNKSELLQNLSVVRLEIPGLSDKFIANSRIGQIDLIWLNPDEGRYAAFEIENSTGVVSGIARLANLTGKLEHLKIPTYVVIPDKFRRMAQKIFDSPSGRMLGSKQRRVIVYSKLLHHIDLLNRKLIRPGDLLGSISEPA
jgi:16S rRNA G966 N2-methylase RsmD